MLLRKLKRVDLVKVKRRLILQLRTNKAINKRKLRKLKLLLNNRKLNKNKRNSKKEKDKTEREKRKKKNLLMKLSN